MSQSQPVSQKKLSPTEVLSRVLTHPQFAGALLSRQPKTPESLWQYVAMMGFRIPRVAVCDGSNAPEVHQAPFELFSRSFFNELPAALVLAGRGTGKTRSSALLNHLVSKFNPGTVTGHIGAVSRQSTWGYEYLRDQTHVPVFQQDILAITQSQMLFQNGSVVMISTGSTETGVSAIRCHRLVLDEIDMWDKGLFETAQQMVSGTAEHPGQRLMISTRYQPFGLMNQLLEEAEARHFAVYRFCVWECLQRCPECRKRACALYEWTNPFSGEREELCRGRGLKADGFMPLEEVIRDYWSSDAVTWAVQKACYAPSVERLVYRELSRTVHFPIVVPPEVLSAGLVVAGVDWGFDHPFAIAVCARSSGGFWYVVEERRERGVLPEREIEIANEVWARYGADLTFFCGKDEPKSIANWQAAGLPARGATSSRYEQGLKMLQRLIAPRRPGGPRLLISGECPLTFHEMSTLHVGESRQVERIADDLHDAVRYAIESAEDMRLGSGGVFRV